MSAIRRGPAPYNPAERNNIIGALRVIRYVMEQGHDGLPEGDADHTEAGHGHKHF